MSRKPQILGQVAFSSKAERLEIQKYCRKQYGRSFSAQCRFMLLKDKRENETNPKVKK